MSPNPEHSPLPEDHASARDRIIDAAYSLFTREGIQAVGVDRVIAEARVAKMTLYRHFKSKDDLVVAALARRHELWTRLWLEREVERRAKTPAGKLLAIFDALADWFSRNDYEGCFFIQSLLEVHDPANPVRAASSLELARIRSFVGRLATDAGARDPDELVRKWQLLMMGAIVARSNDDQAAATHARALGSLLLDSEGLGP